MSEALNKMRVAQAKRMALECYDEIKMDFTTKIDPTISEECQAALYNTLHDFAQKHKLETHDMLVIVKQLLLNVCAMSAEVILDRRFETSMKEAQEELR
jgi:hypothetical protein